MSEKELSVFLSGTRRDLPEFWPAARNSLAAALPDIAVRMMEDAEPEDISGDHWSRREATRPDVLVGLVGRYYGNVLRGQELSLSEQEFDTAGQVGIERLMFTTDASRGDLVEAQDQDGRRKIAAFRHKVDAFVFRRGVNTHAEFAEHVVAAVRQWERSTLRGALQSADSYFAPLLKPDLLFDHTEPLVGQAHALGLLRDFVASTRRVFILHAPWGRGKSRVLLEFARTTPGLPVRFLRADSPLTRTHLAISAIDPMTLVIEDLSQLKMQEIRRLISFLNRCAAGVKLVVASRASRMEFLEAALRSEGVPSDAIEMAELPPLSDQEQRALVSQVLGQGGEPAHVIAIRTRGSTLAAVLASRMIGRGLTTFPELDRASDFVRQVLGCFRDALLDVPGLDVSVRQRLQGLLQVVALVAPVRPSAAAERDALATFLGSTPESVIRDLSMLEDLGLVIRRGGLLTLPVEAVRNTEALQACLSPRGEPTGLADRALRELSGAFRRNLLRTLARVEWQAALDGQPLNLLDELWPALESAYEAMPALHRLSLLQDLEGVSPYQPKAALRFARFARGRGLGPPETDELALAFGPPKIDRIYDAITGVIRGSLYDPTCVFEACDLLWQMAKHDPRPAPQHTECAERALTDLASLESFRPIACYEALLDWLERRVTDRTVPGHRLVNYLRPLLAKEVEHGYADEEAMHFRAERVIVEKVMPLHERALVLLHRIAEQPDLRGAAQALAGISDAIAPPAGAFGRPVEPDELNAWQPEQIASIGRLRSLAVTLDRRVIDLCALTAVHGAARYSTQEPIARAAQDLVKELLERADGTIALALMPFWGPPWGPQRGSQDAHAAHVAKIGASIRESGTATPEIVSQILTTHVELDEAGLQPQARMLLQVLASELRDFGEAFLRSVLDGGDPPVAEDAAGALESLREHSPDRFLFYLGEAVVREARASSAQLPVATSRRLGDRWPPRRVPSVIGTLLWRPTISSLAWRRCERFGRPRRCHPGREWPCSSTTILCTITRRRTCGLPPRWISMRP